MQEPETMSGGVDGLTAPSKHQTPGEVFASPSLGHWLLSAKLSHPLSKPFAFVWIHSSHLLLNQFVWTTQLCRADIFMWFLFPVIEWSQVNCVWKGEEKRAPCTASAAESVPPHAACGPYPASLEVALTKKGFPRFYCKTEKYFFSSSDENVTPLKFPAFLSHLYSVLGRDWGNLRWPRRENSRMLSLSCLNS